METLPLFAADRHGFTGEERKTLKGDEVGRKKSEVEREEREKYGGRLAAAVASPADVRGGDGRSREREEIG